MIAIINIDPNPRTDGVHLYNLCINNNVICSFEHDRSESLDKCLLQAAKAYKEHRKKYIQDLLDMSFEK